MGVFLRGCCILAPLAGMPRPALAHAADGGIVLLLPTGYYLLGGTLAVAASMLVAALMPAGWATGLFRARTLWRGRLPRIEVGASLAGAAVLAGLVWIGFTGTRDPLENPLPLAVWTLWWVALPLVCALVGNVWAAVNPWSGFLTATGLGRGVLTLPREAGYMPATLLFLGFAWYELVWLSPEDPAGLARAVSAYVGLTLVAAMLFGWRAWSERGECFSVFFGFIARLAPLQWSREGETVHLRAGFPGFGVLHGPAITVSGALFILLALATVSFDGLSRTFTWLGLIGVNPLQFPGRSGVMVPNTFGLVWAWAVLGSAFFACIAVGRWLGRGDGPAMRGAPMAGRLALTILPISLAYHVAHYLTVLMVNGQYARAAGERLVGLEPVEVTTSFLNTMADVERIWQAQSGAIVAGHVLAVLLAHASMVEATGDGREATRRGAPLAALMIGYTAFGLWLLAAPTGA